MTVLAFMKSYALPGQAMESARGKAVEAVIGIFGGLTESSGRVSKEQTKAYKKDIMSLFEKVDSSTVSGGKVEGKISKYFSDGRGQQERRRNVVRLGLVLYLKEPRTHTPPPLYSLLTKYSVYENNWDGGGLKGW